MPRLKCGVDSCTYWHKKYCVRDGILVKGETALSENETKCSSYRKGDRKATDRSYKFEIGRIGDPKFLDVSCEAMNCVFNKRRICHAEDIKIDGSRARRSSETFCSSFELKKSSV